MPWLPSEPTAKKALDLVPVHCAMSAPVVTLREEMRIEDMRQVLRQTRHNGFPVVRDTAAGQVSPDALLTAHCPASLVDCLAYVGKQRCFLEKGISPERRELQEIGL